MGFCNPFFLSPVLTTPFSLQRQSRATLTNSNFVSGLKRERRSIVKYSTPSLSRHHVQMKAQNNNDNKVTTTTRINENIQTILSSIKMKLLPIVTLKALTIATASILLFSSPSSSIAADADGSIQQIMTSGVTSDFYQDHSSSLHDHEHNNKKMEPSSSTSAKSHLSPAPLNGAPYHLTKPTPLDEYSAHSALHVRWDVHSTDSQTETLLVFTNSTSSVIDLWWIDYCGCEVYYGSINPGTTHMQPSFASHPWVVRDHLSQNSVLVLVATPNPIMAVVKSI